MKASSDPRYPADKRIENVFERIRPVITVKGRPPVRRTMSERMEHFRIPGVSSALIDDGKIVWAGGFGVKQAGTNDPVTDATLFQVASISKPVTAAAALRLVEQGKLSLDEDINRYLSSWKLPENEFIENEKVTLRRILSHTAGLTVHGFSGYGKGEPVPSLMQVLDGEPPANSEPIRVDAIPGSQWRYSGGGYTILQQMLTDIMEEPFPALMKHLILDPLRMNLSTFEQPLPDSRHREASFAHDAEGKILEGNYHTYPEIAAAGLWTTPTELAQWMIDISESWNGQPGKMIAESMAKHMMTVEQTPSGLGVMLDGEGETLHFSHGGSNEGFQSYFIMYPAAGKGAVVMTNSDLGGMLVGELFATIGAEFNWPGIVQTECEVVTMSEEEIKGLTGTFAVSGAEEDMTSVITALDDALSFNMLNTNIPIEIYHLGNDTFIAENGISLSFVRNESGQATKLDIGGIEAVRV